MKKLTLFTTMLLLAVMQAWAAPVGTGSARSMVLNFLNNSPGDGTQQVPPAGGYNPQLVHSEVSSVDATQNAYYIYNTGSGFVVVAGDDRASGILAYGDQDLDMDNIPDGMQFILDDYKEQIDYLLARPGLVVQTPVMYATRSNTTAVEPMLTALWNQDAPFNNMVPVHEDKPCMTGCSCTALCQVMYYWKHPLNAVPCVPEYTTATYGIPMPGLPSTTFDWYNMIESYSGTYTQAQADAVAELMLYVGQAEKMNYGPRPKGSTAHILLIRRAAQMLGYNPDSEVISKNNSGYSDAEWEELMLNELYAGRPIVYTAKDSIKNVSHAFDVDGYDGEKYHINWGWGGNSDGYFTFRAFNPGSYQFNTQHLMIVGLEPAFSAINVNNTKMSFTAATGGTQQQTFIVTGTDLTGDLKLELDDESGCYAIDKTTIAMDAATAGDTITVTYSPTDEGESLASIIISGSCAEPRTVSLSGVANTAVPSISVNKSVVAFNNTYVIFGTGSTQSVTVTGTNLVNNLELSISGGNSTAFTVAKTVFTPENAAEGINVSVRFKPSSQGVNKATLCIRSDGAETVNIPLIGVGTIMGEKNTGTFHADPSSLSMQTQVGVPVTATFRVTYSSNLDDAILYSRANGNDNSGNDDGNSTNMVTLRPATNDRYTAQTSTIDDKLKLIIMPGDLIPITPIVKVGGIDLVGDNCFSITPNRVTYIQLKTGVDITVTYNPTQAGSHEAYIAIPMPILSIYTATPILVHVTGTAADGETLMAPQYGNDDTEEILELEPFEETNEDIEFIVESATSVDELPQDVEIHAEGQNLIIETPVDQTAVISDIAGHARSVNLRPGRNAIPVNASGIHIVRVGNHTAKLLLR